MLVLLYESLWLALLSHSLLLCGSTGMEIVSFRCPWVLISLRQVESSADNFVAGVRTVYWRKKSLSLLLSEQCYKGNVLASKWLSQKLVGLRVIWSRH